MFLYFVFADNATRVAKLTLFTLINIGRQQLPPCIAIASRIILTARQLEETNMPMSDVAAALIYTEHGNGTTKHAKAPPPPPSTTPPTTATTTGTGAVSNMTNSSKADVIAGGATVAAAAAQLGSMLAPATSLALANMQGQKWQTALDLDKMIKQLRAAEKMHLRGAGRAGGNSSSNSSSGGSAGSAGNEAKQAPHVVQVQRLNAADMAYYDMVPKQATRDIVVCNACSGSYTKAGFNNHIALQHPNIWDTIPNKLNGTEARANATAAAVAENSQDGLREPAELLGSPTDTLSATMSSCSNGSSSSLAAANNNSNTHASSSSASSSSSSRHKSSSSKSSSSSKTSSSGSSSTGRSRSKSSKNRHHSDVHHKVGSKKSSASAIATAAPASIPAAAAVPVAVKDEAPPQPTVQPPITVFSSSSNSSCSLPPTPTLAAVASNGNEHAVNYSPAPAQLANMLDETQPSKKKVVYTSTILLKMHTLAVGIITMSCHM